MDNVQLNPSSPQEDSPIWLKYGVRLLGSVASLVAIGLGAFACVTVYPTCILAGILQMIVGVFVALVEAPCLCLFLDFAQIPGNFFDRRPYWNKALVYVILSIFPLVICRGFSTFFGSGLIFITGALYGIMALGKKADASEMRARAASTTILLPSAQNFQQLQEEKPPINYATQEVRVDVASKT